MKRSILVLVSVITVVLWFAGQAMAADKDEAKRLFESGLKLMKTDDFAAAAANFERSSALYPTQNSLFNLANCYKAMQRYAEALDVLKRLRQEFGDKLKPDIKEAASQQEAEIQSVIATLVLTVEPVTAKVTIDGRESPEKSAAGAYLLAPGDHNIEASLPGHRSQRRLVRLVSGAQTTERVVLEVEPGYLVVRSEPSGAVVVVDDVEKAKTPTEQALALNPGHHVIVLRLPGRKPAERSLEIQAGERQVLELALALVETDMPAPVPALAPVSQANPLVTATPADADKPHSRAWKIVAWSTAAGALAAGSLALVIWKVFADGHFKDAQKYNDLVPADRKNEPLREDALSKAQRDGRTAVGLGIGAGLLAATSVTAFILDSRQSSAKPTASVSLTASGVALRF